MDTPNVTWLPPQICRPPHRVTHQTKLIELANIFLASGWDPTKPSLVGYKEPDGAIQLLSGSHRFAAAMLANIKIPIRVYSYNEIRAAWGDITTWQKIMESGNAIS